MSNQEYGLFNILPDGKSIDDIPKELRWLYSEPFQVSYSSALMEMRADEINRARKQDFDRPGYHFPVKTFCEVRQRMVTYTPWRNMHETATVLRDEYQAARRNPLAFSGPMRRCPDCGVSRNQWHKNDCERVKTNGNSS